MRVGVEEALREDLAVVGLEELARGLLAVGSLGRLPDRDPLDLLHHEQALARQLVVHVGNGEPRIVGDHVAHPLDVARLRQEVELALERVG